ncbi:hypothetical protein [Dorea longicatena]|uniref:hypothetical protein n=1 Tax=Dorea longicatena TaxID=88431 RepID=UPI0018975A1A|nr:hypothetical protein [Dorea longicatena]
MIENKEKLLYSAQRAIKRISEVEAENILDEKESFFVIGTALHWAIDCIDRIPDTQIMEEHKKLFSGLRFANNCLKHNITFTKAHKVRGHSYPYTYPYCYSMRFIWLSLDEIDVWSSKENQRINYKNNFEGKNVYRTMSEIMNEIEKYYEIL